MGSRLEENVPSESLGNVPIPRARAHWESQDASTEVCRKLEEVIAFPLAR